MTAFLDPGSEVNAVSRDVVKSPGLRILHEIGRAHV